MGHQFVKNPCHMELFADSIGSLKGSLRFLKDPRRPPPPWGYLRSPGKSSVGSKIWKPTYKHLTRSPSALSHPFVGWEGSPTKIIRLQQKVGTLLPSQIWSSPQEPEDSDSGNFLVRTRDPGPGSPDSIQTRRDPPGAWQQLRVRAGSQLRPLHPPGDPRRVDGAVAMKLSAGFFSWNTNQKGVTPPPQKKSNTKEAHQPHRVVSKGNQGPVLPTDLNMGVSCSSNFSVWVGFSREAKGNQLEETRHDKLPFDHRLGSGP